MPQIVLYQFPSVLGLPSVSPYCTKVQMALRFKDLAYETVSTVMARRHNPRGKLPYLLWDGRPVEDSTAIVQLVDQHGRGPSLTPADPRLAADAHILEDWADESLYWFGVYAKFHDQEGWQNIRSALAPFVPGGVRRVVPLVARRKILGKLRAQGLTTRSRDLVFAEFENHLEALSRRLDRGPYLVGDALSIADLAVVPMLWQLDVGATPAFGRRIDQHPALTEYIKRVCDDTRIHASS